jgi:16S rRNA (cytidine1402-2'-O)-methyltransferase
MTDPSCENPLVSSHAAPEPAKTPNLEKLDLEKLDLLKPDLLKAGLVLVSTPIGNLGDVSARALATLRHADLLLCEDTRTTATLLRHFGIAARTAALHDHNEDDAIPGILARLRGGAMIALVSDAGTPLVSDPGYRLVRAAIAEGLPVTAIPGANAAVMALTLSGLPPHPHLFQGFLPPKQAARRTVLARLRAAEQAGLSATLIFYEAPHRAAETLADMAEIFGPRPAALARELTKKFEQVLRDGLPGLAAHCAAVPPRGEVTLLVGPPDTDDAQSGEADLDDLLALALRTQSVREAAAGVAEATGLPRKQVYARALEMVGR